MVKHVAIAVMVFNVLLPYLAWAAEFTAKIKQNQVAVGERFTLTLKLAGASAKSKPSVSALNKHFDVTGRRQSSSTTIINGEVSSSTSWIYTLTPKKEGDINIPSLSVNTSDGKMSSQPIAISVGKASSLPSANKQQGITISAKVSKRNPYKNEPLTYTARLISHHNIANVTLSEMSIENAIVEAIGKPKIDDQVQKGIAVKVIEVKYRIIPLQPGEMTIPAMVVQGGIPIRGSRLGSRLDNDSDPFDMFRNLDRFGTFGVTKLEPFSVASNAITVEVKPPIAQVTPWLPAASLEIAESWEDQQVLKVGEPITRGFTMVAEGVAASQLPSLEAQQNKTDEFKVYADNPIVEDDIKNGNVISWRQENYTLIPQKAGTLTLPEISVSWWNVDTDKLAYATIPARTLDILPGAQTSDMLSNEQTAEQTAIQQNAQRFEQAPISETIMQTLPGAPRDNRLLYAVIAGLLILLMVVFFWVINLQRKVTRLVENKDNAGANSKSKEAIKKSSASNSPTIHNKALEKVTSAKEMQHFLQRYGHEHWNTSNNAPLEALIFSAKQQYPNVAKDADLLLKSLQDSLYADKDINIEELKAYCAAFLEGMTRVKRPASKRAVSNSKSEKLPDLNPS